MTGLVEAVVCTTVVEINTGTTPKSRPSYSSRLSSVTGLVGHLRRSYFGGWGEEKHQSFLISPIIQPF